MNVLNNQREQGVVVPDRGGIVKFERFIAG